MMKYDEIVNRKDDDKIGNSNADQKIHTYIKQSDDENLSSISGKSKRDTLKDHSTLPSRDGLSDDNTKPARIFKRRNSGAEWRENLANNQSLDE
jgi:hypothetical protein